jgi:ParB family transcriptional regulator, chromosome partitioning protein
MAKNKGLGRGLDALLDNDDEPKTDDLRQLPLSALRPGRYQPRTRMDQASLAELADSIRGQGVLQPIVVRPVADGGYEIIAGERRWRAAQLAALDRIPALVRDIPDEATLAISLIENIQREGLNPLEEAAGIQRLIDEFGLTHESAARAVGRSRSAVTNLLRLLQLAPPVRDALMDSRLEMGHARALLALSPDGQAEVAREVMARHLSVRDTEQLVRRRTSPPPPPKKAPDRDVERLAEELSDALGTRVAIVAGAHGAGHLTIHYADLEQLDRILARIRGA